MLPENKEQVVPITEIGIPPNLSRLVYDEDALAELAESIEKVGLINAITVKPKNGHYELIAGSRRLQACKLLRYDLIRANVIAGDSSHALATMAHENLFRADLSPMEETIFYHRLIEEEKMTEQQLVHLTGKGENYVKARLKLFDCIPEIQAAVGDGKVPISHGLMLQTFPEGETRLQYLNYAISTGANLQTIRYWKQQLDANANIPTGSDEPPQPLAVPYQPTVFGWNCFVCDNFHEAKDMQTIHLCSPCFLDLKKATMS